MALCFVLFAAAFLSGCGGVMLELESDIKQQLTQAQEHMVANVYNQQQQVDFDSTESDNYIEDEVFFVLLSSKVKDEINKIRLGGVDYEKDQTITTKLQGQNSITRKAFLKQDEKLFVSSLLMFLNANNDGELAIEFPDNKIKRIVVDVYEQDNTLKAEPLSQEGELNTMDENNLKFDFKNDNHNGKVFVRLSDDDQPLLATAPVIIQVVANPGKSNQSLAHKFEMPQSDLEHEGMGVVISIGLNGGVEYEKDSPPNHKLIYNFYVPQIGNKTVTVNFFNTK